MYDISLFSLPYPETLFLNANSRRYCTSLRRLFFFASFSYCKKCAGLCVFYLFDTWSGARYERARTQKENIWVIKGTKGYAGGKARICPLGGPDGPNCCVQLTKVIFFRSYHNLDLASAT